VRGMTVNMNANSGKMNDHEMGVGLNGAERSTRREGDDRERERGRMSSARETNKQTKKLSQKRQNPET